MVDTLAITAPQMCDCMVINDSVEWVDSLTAIAMTFIAITDVLLTIAIFSRSRKDSKSSEDNHRKFELMHSLILEHNINSLYDFYDNLTTECAKLLTSEDKIIKDEVNKSVKSEAKKFRLRFLTLFNVIDVGLYDSLKEITDNLVDGITNSIYDPGIKLTYEPKYDVEIVQKISRSRVDMLKKLYSMYRVKE